MTVAALHKTLKYSEWHKAVLLILNLAIHSEPPGFFLDGNSIPRTKNTCEMGSRLFYEISDLVNFIEYMRG